MIEIYWMSYQIDHCLKKFNNILLMLKCYFYKVKVLIFLSYEKKKSLHPLREMRLYDDILWWNGLIMVKGLMSFFDMNFVERTRKGLLDGWCGSVYIRYVVGVYPLQKAAYNGPNISKELRLTKIWCHWSVSGELSVLRRICWWKIKIMERKRIKPSSVRLLQCHIQIGIKELIWDPIEALILQKLEWKLILYLATFNSIQVFLCHLMYCQLC